MFEAITFDFWDTLYIVERNREYLENRVRDFQEALLDLGVEKEPLHIEQAFQQGWKQAHYYQRRQGREIKPEGHLAIILKELQLEPGAGPREQLYEAYTTYTWRNPPRLNEYAVEILRLIAPRYRTGVICNTGATPGRILREIMVRDQIIDYYDHLVFSDEFGRAKPDRSIFHYTLERIEGRSARAVHIGDDPVTDVAGAKQAGMSAVWLADREMETSPAPDFHIQHLIELHQILEI